MKNLIKSIGMYVIAGAAVAAGTTLWHNVIEEKIDFVVEKHRNRKKNNVIKFERRLSR